VILQAKLLNYNTMKKMDINLSAVIEGGNCLWWLVPAAASWIASIFFFPAAIGFVGSVAGYGACIHVNGGSDTPNDYQNTGNNL
jgi:hypothetical protein